MKNILINSFLIISTLLVSCSDNDQAKLDKNDEKQFVKTITNLGGSPSDEVNRVIAQSPKFGVGELVGGTCWVGTNKNGVFYMESTFSDFNDNKANVFYKLSTKTNSSNGGDDLGIVYLTGINTQLSFKMSFEHSKGKGTLTATNIMHVDFSGKPGVIDFYRFITE